MKTFFQTNTVENKTARGLLSGITLSAVMLSGLSFVMVDTASAQSFMPIVGQMDLGARGNNVTNLQTFIAANPSIYPEGLVTGYFGGLTFKAVKNFQAQYGFEQVGRAGPLTVAKMNSLIATGGWTTADMSGPSFYNVTRTVGSNQITFTFNTDENTMSRVVYGTSPLMFNEGDMNSNGFGAIGGYTVNSGSGMSTTHSVTLPNLNANTVYYYTVIATDAAGNVSVAGPNNSMRTNQ